MASLEKISEYVKVHPGMKAREIARHLGMARKSVNSILYRNGNLFIKDENHNWALKDADTQAQPNEPSEPQLSETIHVENIDLANRLKASLEENPNQRITALSSSLKVKRQTISRTLNSFPDIFSKNSDREWNILPESEKSSSSHDLETRTEIAIPAETEVLAPTDYKETLPASPRSIIEAKLDRNILVLAPPGTGKTHTLIERLIHTLSNSDRNTDPGELLVLSFSRPVVGEIKERLASAIREGAPDRLRYVRVRTFDSYATWLLHDGDYDLSAKNYDDRIELLTRNLREQTLVQSTNRIGKTRFLFVDEIQDLVGIRADMVFELVKRVLASNGAVNLLGDPNQAITEYQIRNDSIDSSEFIEKVKKLLLGNLDELELDQYYRFETKEMQSLVKNAKRIMDDTEISPTEKIEQITKLLPILDQNKFVELVDEGEISALLCRSNAEVFMSKKWFENRDIEHTVNLGSTGRPWAPWIGAILMQFNQSKISIQTLENRIQELETGPISCTSQEMKDLLHRENLIRGKVIDLSELSRKVSHTSPAAKPRVAGNRLELSTIHKAKGLGYDTVVIKEPSQHNNVTDEEARVLYVALTRAKRNL